MHVTNGNALIASDDVGTGPASSMTLTDFYPQARRALLHTLGRQNCDHADDIVHDALLIVFERWEYKRSDDHRGTRGNGKSLAQIIDAHS